MKISTKILGITGVILVLLGIEFWLNTQATKRIERDTVHYREITIPLSSTAAFLVADTAHLANLLIKPEPDSASKVFANIALHLAEAQNLLIRGSALHPEDRDQWSRLENDLVEIEKHITTFESAWPQLLHARQYAPAQVTAQSLGLEQVIYGRLQPAVERYHTSLRPLLDTEVDRINTTTRRQIAIQRNFTYAVCSILLVMALSFLRSAIRPLQQLATTAHAIASGNRTLRVSHIPKNELGAVAAAINHMLDSLQASSVSKAEQEQLVQRRTEELQQLNARLDFLLSASPATIFTTTPTLPCTTTFISANQEKMLGFAPEEFQASYGLWLGQIHPEDKDSVLGETTRVLEHGYDRNDYRFRHKDGTWRWLRADRRLVHGPDGHPSEIIGCVIDITAEKGAMARQETYRQRLDLALGATNICTWENDTSRNRLTLDVRWAEIVGNPPGETVTTARSLFHLVHPDDRKASLAAVRQVQNASADSYQIEQRVHHNDGSWRWILSSGRVIARDRTGRPLRIIGTNTDITTRKQAELALQESRSQLDLALQSSGLGVWRRSIVDGQVAFDEQCCHILGLDSPNYRGDPDAFLCLVHPEDRHLIKVAINDVLKKDVRYEADYRVLTSDGETRHISDRGKLVRNTTGKPLHIDGIMRDVTHAKQAETVLREDAERLTQLFMAAPAATCLSDVKTSEFIEVNDRFVELTERPRKALIGHRADKIGLWHNINDLTKITHSTISDGRVDYEEVAFVLSDGNILDVGLSVALVPVGDRQCALTCVTDLTARNQAIAALRDREKLISSINSNLRGTWLYRMIYHADGRMQFTYVSPNVENIMGIEAAALLADGERVFSLIHPDDLPSIKRSMEHEVRTGGATSITVRVNHPDGHQRWMQVRSQFAEKRPDGAQVRDGTVSDVTASRVAQIKLALVGERLELALRSSRTCTWHNDLIADRLTMDAAWSEMIGREPRETVTTSRQLMRIVHPDDRPRIIAEVKRIARQHDDDYLVEHRVRTFKGEWIWIRSHGRVTERDKEGSPIRILGTNTDITSRKLAEEKVHQQAEFLASLHETSLDLLNRRNLPDLFKALVERASTLLSAPYVEILLKEDEVLTIHASTNHERIAAHKHISRQDAPLSWLALETKKVQTTEDYSIWPHQANPYDDDRAYGVIELPILRGAECLGVLSLARSEPNRPFTDDDIQRGEMLARNVALILHNAHAREEAIQEVEHRTTALRLSEERFRRIFDHSPFAIIIYTLLDIRFVDANHAALNLFKTERKTLIGRSSKDFGHWVNESERWRFLAAIRNAGQQESMEAKFRKSDGETFTGLVSGSVIQLNGEPHILSVLLDISERKQAEQARAHSLAILQATLESTADGILAVGTDGQIEAFNHTFAAMWSVPAKVLNSNDDSKLLPIASKQLIEPEAFASRVKYLMQHQHEKSFDLLHFKDGRIFERFSNPMLLNKQPTGRVWSFRDITERKRAETALRESEQRFRGVFDHSPVVIALLSIPEGRFLQVNEAATKTFQYSADEMNNRTSTELGIWADLADRKRYIALLQENLLVLNFETLMRRKDGTYFTALFNGSLVNIDGRPFSLNSIQDITARKAAETSLADSLREKEMLLREIHHRVKNNLQIISSLLHFQTKKAGNEQELAVFKDGQNRLRAMILVHEKLYRSTDFNRINLGDYVRGLAEQLQQSFQDKGKAIKLHTDVDNIPAPVEIALPCGMIVTELVTNAFKYAFAPGASGLIRIAITRSSGGFSLRIRDNGKGLPDDFDLQSEGSFGLQLVNNLAEQLNARISRRPTPGTEIILDVPFPTSARE